MAKGYWIVRVDIADMEQYKKYVAANAAPLTKYGARFLVRAGPFENPEGTSRTRNAVIEFPATRRRSIAGNPPNTRRPSCCGNPCRPPTW